MHLLSQGRTAFIPRFYEIKERDLTLCACQLKGKQFWRSAIEVKGRTLATLGIRLGNGIQCDNMNRKVESKLTRSIWIGRRSCYAWPSRDPRSKCYAWCAWENSKLCIPCIRGGRLKISAKSSRPNYTTAAHGFLKAMLRLGLRAPFVARNNLYYRMNFKNLTANLWRLSLPFYYWQSHLPYGSAAGLLLHIICLSGNHAWNSSR